MVGSSAVIGSWKIIEISLPRSSRYAPSDSPTSSRPSSLMEPVTRADSGSSPRIARMVTDLPEPDCPMMPSRSLSPSVNDTPLTAGGRRPNAMVRSLTSRYVMRPP